VSGRPMERSEPAYGLPEVRRAFSEGRFQTTGRVMRHLDRRGWSRGTIGSCVASLTFSDFHKSQQHRMRPDAWLDIYKPLLRGERLYVKLTLQDDGAGYRVMSFCRDGEEH
jgi:hypothetical protein